MNVVKHIKYRWKHNRTPLPGELEPTRDGVTVVWASEIVDKEPSLVLRKLRGVLLGYGQGWTFKAALRERMIDVMPLLVLAVLVAWVLFRG